MSSHFYVLEGHTPVPASGVHEWAERWEKKDRIVRQDTLRGILVSTVFLGLDHNWGDGPPVLFETMIFGGFHDHYQIRYCTWEEAEQGHKVALRKVKHWLWLPTSLQDLFRKVSAAVNDWWWSVKSYKRRQK